MVAPTIAEALAILREVLERDFPGFDPVGISVHSRVGLTDIRLPLLHQQADCGQGRGLSPTELLILRALEDGLWKTGQQLADAVGVPKSSAFSAILSNMAEAGILESSTRHGYRKFPANTATQ